MSGNVCTSVEDSLAVESAEWPRWKVLLLITLAVVAVYSNSFDADFHFDDTHNIIQNYRIRDFSRLGWYVTHAKRPVSYFTFWVNYSLSGLDVTGFHILNVAIHILAAFFMYLFVHQTLTLPSVRERYGKYAFIIALSSSLLWALNPVQTQAVTYIVQRMASMAGMFYLIAFYTYARFRTAQRPGQSRLFLILTVLFYLLSVGSKENTALFPLAVVAYELIFFHQTDIRFFRKYGKYVISAAVMLAAIVYFINNGLTFFGFKGEQNIFDIMRMYNDKPFTMAERIMTEWRVLVHYFLLFVMPLGYSDKSGLYIRLNIDYDYPISHGLFDPVSTFFCLVVLAGLLVYAFQCRKTRPVFCFFILWYFINNIIESTFLPLAPVFEHRVYLPSVAFAVLLVIGVLRVTGCLSLQNGVNDHEM